MSEIRITNQQPQQNINNNTAVQSQLTNQFANTLRVGQNLNARLIYLENKYWLVVENIKIFIPEETVRQWNLKVNQVIKLKIRSLTEPVELQIINSRPVASETVPSAITTHSLPVSEQTSNTEPLLRNDAASQTITTKNDPDKNQISNQNTQKPDAEKLIAEVRKYLASTAMPAVTTVVTSPANLQRDKILTSTNTPSTVTKNPDRSTKVGAINQQSNLISPPLVTETIPSVKPVNKNNSEIKSIPGVVPGVVAKSADKSNPKTAEIMQSLISASKTAISEPNKPISQPLEQVSSTKQQNIRNIQSSDNVLNPAVFINTPASDNSVPSNAVDTHPIGKIDFSERMKFEIPVILPDKERFPMLSEKLITAYDRNLQQQKPGENSLNKLLSQLQRLNQWSAENKSSRGSSSGSQSEKLATDLKQSLKDLFRYISNKNDLKSPRSIEKAIRQSGAFLEKRLKSQDNPQNKPGAKLSAELTIHKDLKANLNRVLATALYNLARINTTQSTPTQTATTQLTANNPAKTQGNNTTQSTAAHQQLTDKQTLPKHGLLANIRNQLIKITAGKTSMVNLQQLESIIKEVLKNTQAALSRTQLSQLTNLRPDTSPQQWLFELPVMNNKDLDIVSMYLKQHTDSEDESSPQKGWSLVLQFDIGHLGKIRAMLFWDENRVQVRFIAEQRSTVALVDNELNHFKQKLTDQGLLFEQLSIEQAQLDDLSIQFSRNVTNG